MAQQATDRISPPPAPASVRPTPLCHAQSQTRAVVLSLDPLPPAAESPSNGRALRPRRQFQPYNARSTLWRSPRWAWRVCRHYSCAVCRCFRCDFPPFSAGGNRKFSTIDCRFLVNPQTRFMMHVGLNDPSYFPGTGAGGLFYGQNTRPNAQHIAANQRFTNVLPDARANSRNFFNTAFRNDQSTVCETASGQFGPDNAGGITTWRHDWARAADIGQGAGLEEGACLVGVGAHFCSRGRYEYAMRMM